MKKLFALLALVIGFAMVPAVALAAPTPNHHYQYMNHVQQWNVIGNYVISFNCVTCVPHNIRISSYNRHTGVFSGYGALATNPAYSWTVSGTVSGDQIAMRILYTGTNAGYYVDLTGTIARNGTMSGSATQSSGGSFTWTATRGCAWFEGDRDDPNRW